MRRLCTILARGGSKGLPGKNLRPLGGKPLVVHTILQAKQSRLFEAIALSSDADEVLKIARDSGIDFAIRRPPQLATDVASKIAAIHHCAAKVERRLGGAFDVIVDLDVTSPLRTVDDIRGAVELLEDRGGDERDQRSAGTPEPVL
jgi:N-acylneuraminate cytidylyltransferase/CMP-N,N'-diacetyllegionaminic acid synthase